MREGRGKSCDSMDPNSQIVDKKEVEEWLEKVPDDDLGIRSEMSRLIEHYLVYEKMLETYHTGRDPPIAPTIPLDYIFPRFIFIVGREGSGRTSLSLGFSKSSRREWAYLDCDKTPG